MTTQLKRIGQKARGEWKPHHLTAEFLRETWGLMNRRGAGGIDGETAREFERGLDRRIPELIVRHKAHKYQAPLVSRVEIPKPGSAKRRSLGVPTAEDRPAAASRGAGTRSDLSQGPYQYVAYAR